MTGLVGPDLAGTRFGKMLSSHARVIAVPSFICSDASLVTYVRPSFLKTHTAHAFLAKTIPNNNHIEIFDAFPTETVLITINRESWPATVAVPDSADSYRIWARPNLRPWHRIITGKKLRLESHSNVHNMKVTTPQNVPMVNKHQVF